MKRMQNISMINTSVMKKRPNGDYKAITVRPGQIIHLDDDDVQMTNDSYNPQNASPLVRGLVSEIPEGLSAHPDFPGVSRNPSSKQAQEAIKGGKAAELIEKVSDFRGLLIFRRALDAERNALSDSQFSEVNRLINSRTSVIEQMQIDNASKFKMKV